MKATVYHSRTNAITYSGTKIPSNYDRESYYWCALSEDLLKLYPIGTEIVVEGISGSVDNVYCVMDKMNSRHKNMLDLLVVKDSLKGSWKNIRISKVN